MEPETPTEPKTPGVIESVRAATLGRRDKLVAALELLRERKAMDAQHEQTIVSTYEAGDDQTKDTIVHLVERLEVANFGKVIIGIGEKAAEVASAVGEAGVDADMVKALAGDHAGAIDDVISKGRMALGATETVDMERTFVKWSVESIEKMERILVQTIIGAGTLLMVVAALWAAYQVPRFQNLVTLLSIGLVAVLGLALVAWSGRVSEWARESRQEMEELLEETPSQRLSGLIERNEAKPVDRVVVSPDPPTDK